MMTDRDIDEVERDEAEQAAADAPQPEWRYGAGGWVLR